MRELRTCDFCGTDAVGVFEVLPPELTPASDQKRVVLCDHCQETLTDVIAPLLTRLGVDEQSSSGHQTQSGRVDGDAEDAEPTPPEPADHDSPDADDPADPLEDESARESVAPEGVEEASEDDEEASEGIEEPAETPEEADAVDIPSEPPQFRKVVRILQNREFPVERADVEALASNAYDLDDQQVADIFDYAVERGILVDDDGTLRKP
ncbi:MULTISPECIES: hypothetical protein [Haloferax]|uniref:Uncharacterized protein n=1 Tax=Haloferax marinum TaxID=2666143 RepID=A0A6A8G889_9EURY|nr:MULTISPECIES: hypothetical protein [Haloferax]KAB1197752.1 hypothetical protein Hfx1150_09540 [Haloferax sp. CBA1150]MRW96808.1 hypothetical protein [Haloferax marinum]